MNEPKLVRREWLIVLGVLVPFGALVGAGLWWSYTAAPVTPGAIAVDQPPPQLPPPLAPPSVGDPPATTLPKPPIASAPASPVSLENDPYPRALEAPLKAVEKPLLTCVVDQRLRVPTSLSLTVSFEPTRDGGFRRVTVASSWQDPYLQACAEDVFDELSWAPTGAETYEAASHTFRFKRSR